MNNVRGLYPPLYGAPANGGGGGGGSIQVDTLPEASLEYKDKIVQYTGATTETLTNGYFYKCVEHTETEGETITVTYSWDNIPVMEVDSGGGITYSTTETVIGTYLDKTLYSKVYVRSDIPSLMHSSATELVSNVTNIDKIKDITLSYELTQAGFNRKGTWYGGSPALESGSIFYVPAGTADLQTINKLYIIIEYTKTTD